MKKLALLLMLLLNIYAQNDLNIFGYYQTFFQYNDGYDIVLNNTVYKAFDVNNPTELALRNLLPPQLQGDNVRFRNTSKNTFNMQQLNLFFSKEFEGKWGNFNSFVNLELNNNFNLEKNYGNIKLEEAWVRYSYNDYFTVKIGLFIPAFNNFNEIKNRMPIIPYLFRPLVYEASINEIIAIQNFVPTNANVQIQGNVDVTEDITANYAIFAGNSEEKYIATNPSGVIYRGQDTTKFKMVGGRIGLKYRTLKFGISGTYDRNNLADLFEGSNLNPNIVRYRFGTDLSFSFNDILFEAELISVKGELKAAHKDFIKNYSKNVIVKKYSDLYNLSNELDNLNDMYNNINLPSPSDPNYINLKNQRMLLLSQIQQKQLQLQQMFTQLQKVSENRLYLGDTYDKLFYYLSLGYNITDEFMPYVSYSYYEDGLDARFKDGMQQYSFGIVYRPITEVVLKAQWTQQNIDKINYKSNFYHAGISVMF
ncbi:MAG TPA: hypothetical protein PK591_06360 [Ignavibacteriales bacterium]|nr:hypothetical protein [Ignavibacteriales bacterium]